MTKKHFIAMAAIFHDAMRQDIGAIGRLGVWNGIVMPFMDYAETVNPLFDRSVFAQAVDYPQTDEQTRLGV